MPDLVSEQKQEDNQEREREEEKRGRKKGAKLCESAQRSCPGAVYLAD